MDNYVICVGLMCFGCGNVVLVIFALYIWAVYAI